MAADDVPLREYVEALREADQRAISAALVAQERAVAAALVAAEKAVAVAEAANREWRANANEWRGAMDDRDRDFARADKLDDVISRLDRIEGAKQGVSTMQALLFSIAGVGFAAMTLYLALHR